MEWNLRGEKLPEWGDTVIVSIGMKDKTAKVVLIMEDGRIFERFDGRCPIRAWAKEPKPYGRDYNE